ncbi:MAG: hypothetical protein JWL76_1610 [Thermoleophilia bacterium]|nr:hypothetical protein [Thermoleophilia bacterium]
MHEIPPLAEQLLRAQGVTDPEFDELRRTGTLRRADGSGATMDITLDGQGNATMQQSSSHSTEDISLNGATLPPEALEKLKRYHKFMPDHVIQNIELATGQDIDGDGKIGGGGSNPPPPSYGATAGATSGSTMAATSSAIPASGAMPTGTETTDGPFVQKRVGGKLFPIVLVLLALGAVAYFVVR